MGATEATQTTTYRYDQMDEKLVDAAIKSNKVKTTKGMALINKAGLLQIHYRKTVSLADLAECDRCGAASSLAEDRCPFCGEGQGAPGAPVVEPKPKAKRAKNVNPSQAIVTTPGPKTEPVSAELVTVNETEALAKLDQTVKEIVALKAGADATQWLLGQKIREVYEESPWRLRRDDKSKPLYKSFGQFCAEEIELSAAYCYKLIDVAKFFTEQQVRSLGSTKLYPALKVPESDRPAFVTKIEKNSLSLRDILTEVKQLTPARRDTGRRPTPDGTPGGNRGQSRHLPEGALTVVIATGVKSLPMYCRPTTGKITELGDQKKAKSIDDKPICVYDLPGDLRMIFQVLEGSTGLVLKIETQKIDPLAD